MESTHPSHSSPKENVKRGIIMGGGGGGTWDSFKLCFSNNENHGHDQKLYQLSIYVK